MKLSDQNPINAWIYFWSNSDLEKSSDLSQVTWRVCMPFGFWSSKITLRNKWSQDSISSKNRFLSIFKLFWLEKNVLLVVWNFGFQIQFLIKFPFSKKRILSSPNKSKLNEAFFSNELRHLLIYFLKKLEKKDQRCRYASCDYRLSIKNLANFFPRKSIM